MSSIPPTEPALTPERLRELIAREYKRLDDAVASIRQGMMSARISLDNGDTLIDCAMHNRDASVRLLRELLSGDE